jgi:superfamily II DNA or RNA helicase
MANLRDICIQVKYQGNVKHLSEKFYEVVGGAAVLHRIFVSALDSGTILPLAPAFLLAEKLKIKTQIILCLPPRLLSQEKPELISKADTSDIQGELIRKLDTLSGQLSIENSETINSLASLEVRICVPDGESQSQPNCIGIFEDSYGSSVAYEANWESGQSEREVLVSWSWGDPKLRVKQEISRFERIWSGETTDTRVVEACVLLVKKLREVLTAIAKESDDNAVVEGDIRLFPHQEKAVAKWIEKPYLGVFKMCTGAGKTISALAAVKVLGEKRAEAYLHKLPVIITVPTRVLADQWIREIKRFGFKSVLAAYNSFEQWNSILEPMIRDKNAEQSRFIVNTYRTFADERFIAKLQRMSELGFEALWVADEMHNLASPRLRGAMSKVEKLFKFRLGLSATPEIEGDLKATESLLNYFGNICASYELADGIKDGVLCRYRYYPIPAYLAPTIGKKYLSLLQEINDESGGSTALVNLYREARDLLRSSGVQIARFRDVLNELMQGNPDLKHTLVYCPPGYGTYGGELSDEIDQDEDERRLIEDVIEILRSKNLSPASILGETNAEQRTQILERFADGRVRALCAIGCLDEGVDVPAIKRAIVLYSVDREKQFVQRRGRILRQPRGTRDKIAEIFDIVILPQGADMPRTQAETLLNREMRRYREFARLAENRQAADDSISKALSVATNTGSTTIIPQHATQN